MHGPTVLVHVSNGLVVLEPLLPTYRFLRQAIARGDLAPVAGFAGWVVPCAVLVQLCAKEGSVLALSLLGSL
eukprot:1265371-Alexandrium_andersonii.AAC.1